MRCYNETLLITFTKNDIENITLFCAFNTLCFFYLIMFKFF
jgi:hypothetical protein